MTKAAVIFNFWNGFGLKAYEENSVPSDATFPYITYQLVTDLFDRPVAMSASLWYRSSSWVEINDKTEGISEALGMGGRILSFDTGKVWLKRGTPFAQNMGDESDDLIKRKYLNIEAEYFSAI